MGAIPRRQAFIGGTGAVGMLKGGGIPLHEHKKFQSFKVSDSHIPKFQRFVTSFHVFLIDIDSICKIFKNWLDGLAGLFGSAFSHIFELFDFRQVEIPQFMFSNMVQDFCCSEVIRCLQKWTNMLLGVTDTSARSKIMNMIGFRVFLKWILKVTSPKRSRITLRSSWANLFLKFTIKLPHPDPPRPRIRIFNGSLGFSVGNHFFPDSGRLIG